MVGKLQRQGHRTPDAGDLVGAGIHGVDAAYIRDMAGALRIHGVTGAFVRRPNEEAGRGLSPDELVSDRLRPRRLGVGNAPSGG